MNRGSGSSVHAMEAELETMAVAALGAHSLDYFVGNFSPAELGEKRDLIWALFFLFVFLDLAFAW